MPQRNFTSRKENQAPGLFRIKQEGIDRLALLFCENAIVFMIRIVLICKAANLKPWRENVNTSFPSFRRTPRRSGQQDLDLLYRCIFPEVRKYLASKGWPFKVLVILDNTPGHPETHEFNIKGVEVVYLPTNTMSLIQPLDQGVIRTFNVHCTNILWKKLCYGREPWQMEHHESLEQLHHLRCHCC